MSTDHSITIQQEPFDSGCDFEGYHLQDTMNAAKRKSFEKVAERNGVEINTDDNTTSTTEGELPGIRSHLDAQVNSTCHLCKRVLRNHKSYIKHLAKTHQVPERNDVEINADDNNATTTEEELPGIGSHTDAQVNSTCYLCKRVLRNHKSYIKHLAKTHQVMSYQCPYCSRCMSSRKMLKLHRRTVCAEPTHSTVRHPCHLCPLEYGRKFDLKRHMYRVHGFGEVATYQCPRCAKTFTRKASRREHFALCGQQKASGEPQERVNCGECNKYFASKQSLNYHKRTIHRELTYTCDNCGKVFRWSKHYYAHIKLPPCQ